MIELWECIQPPKCSDCGCIYTAKWETNGCPLCENEFLKAPMRPATPEEIVTAAFDHPVELIDKMKERIAEKRGFEPFSIFLFWRAGAMNEIFHDLIPADLKPDKEEKDRDS